MFADSVVADHQQCFNRIAVQRQHVLVVFQQGDGLFGNHASQFSVLWCFQRAFFAGAVISDKLGFRHDVEDALYFVVEDFFRNASVFDRIEQRLLEVSNIRAHAHFDICAAQRAPQRVGQSAPVGHNEPFESPFALQDLVI